MEDTILNILIVEDEKPIRDELAQFPWESVGAMVVGEAANGREALDFCAELTPDIALVDLTMPVMDGIEFITRLQQITDTTQCIILTCHADFSYAQKALRLGAVDYLMKAAYREADLREAVDKARRKLAEQQAGTRNTQLDRYWERTSEIHKILTDDLQEKHAKLPAGMVSIQLISGRQDYLFINREIIRFLIIQSDQWFSPIDGVYSVFLAHSIDAKQYLRDGLTTLHEMLNDSLGFLSSDFRLIGIMNGTITTNHDLRDTCARFDAWKDQSFYDRHRVIFEGRPQEMAELDDVCWDGLNRTIERLEESTKELIAYLSHDFIATVGRTRYRPDQIKTLAVAWRQRWMRRFDLQGEDRFLMKISATASLNELVSLLVRELQQEETVDSSGKNLRSEIRRCIRYLREHYPEPVTLLQVAEYVGLSSAYLSRLFKEQTDMSFHEYLTDIRIDAAISLLRSSEMKVYEVAERVGFPSYRYFSSLFKRITGRSPKEYQEYH